MRFISILTKFHAEVGRLLCCLIKKFLMTLSAEGGKCAAKLLNFKGNINNNNNDILIRDGVN